MWEWSCLCGSECRSGYCLNVGVVQCLNVGVAM